MTLHNAGTTAHYCGVPLVEEEIKPVISSPKKPAVRQRLREDGSPWIDQERWRETQRRVWGRSICDKVAKISTTGVT
jgi:hypothetical protein